MTCPSVPMCSDCWVKVGELESLRAQVAALEEDRFMNTEMAKVFSERNKELQAQVAALTEERNFIRREAVGLTIELKQALAEVTRLRAEVAALTDERDAANYAHHYAFEEVTRLRAALEMATTGLEQARDELEEIPVLRAVGFLRERLELSVLGKIRETLAARAPEGKASDGPTNAQLIAARFGQPEGKAKP